MHKGGEKTIPGGEYEIAKANSRSTHLLARGKDKGPHALFQVATRPSLSIPTNMVGAPDGTQAAVIAPFRRGTLINGSQPPGTRSLTGSSN